MTPNTAQRRVGHHPPTIIRASRLADSRAARIYIRTMKRGQYHYDWSDTH